MGIDWSHLPKEVVAKICMCTTGGSREKGFRKDPETEYWVHSKCGKPSVLVAVRECESCPTVFVPRKYSTGIGIECDECNPPNRVRRGKLNLEL